jgi:hypothetical protein
VFSKSKDGKLPAKLSVKDVVPLADSFTVKAAKTNERASLMIDLYNDVLVDELRNKNLIEDKKDTNECV